MADKDVYKIINDVINGTFDEVNDSDSIERQAFIMKNSLIYIYSIVIGAENQKKGERIKKPPKGQ